MGRLLSFVEAQEVAGVIREHAAEQLIEVWLAHKDRDGDPFLWGDETEGIVLSISDDGQTVHPCVLRNEFVDKLNRAGETRRGHLKGRNGGIFQPEGGIYQTEHIPARPGTDQLSDLLEVERSLRARRKVILSQLDHGQSYLNMSLFPRFGAREGSEVSFDRSASGKQRSQFVPDELLDPSERISRLVSNLRESRGSLMAINVPIFRDANTPWPFVDPTVNFGLRDWPEDDTITVGTAKENCIYADAFLFGMGNCCLQVTLQARNLTEARKLHDQLLPMAAIMVALTAATPTFKGYLVDTDSRCDRMRDCVDDRHPRQLHLRPRCTSNATYIAQDPRLKPEFLPSNLPVVKSVEERLSQAGMDARLASHFAYLFSPTPCMVDGAELHGGLDRTKTTHFENINKYNWNPVRFKPPPCVDSPDVGWRVEFRPMEIQFTDHENAAFIVFIVLLARTVVHFNLNLYIPIPLVDENSESAKKRDAIGEIDHAINKFSVDEIINGRPSRINAFPGILPLMRRYLASRTDINTIKTEELEKYLTLVQNRASGKRATNAKWQRDFIRSHPGYNRDSKVTARIAYDLVKAVRSVT